MIAITITLIGLLYIYIVYICIKYVMKKTKKIKYAVLTIVFFALLPTWDVILGKIYFGYLCKTQGGLKIYKTFKVNNFLDMGTKTRYINNKVYSSDIKKAEKFLDYGFQYYEVPTYHGLIIHFYKNNDNIVVYKILNEPESKYKYIQERHKIVSYIFGIYSSQQLIEDRNGSKVIESTSFYRMGWTMRLIDNYLGGVRSESCFKPDSFTYEDDFKQKLLKGSFYE